MKDILNQALSAKKPKIVVRGSTKPYKPPVYPSGIDKTAHPTKPFLAHYKGIRLGWYESIKEAQKAQREMAKRIKKEGIISLR